MNKKSGKLIITSYTYDKAHKKGITRSVACFIAENKLEYIKIIPEHNSLPAGSIVTGKVTNVVKNIPAAFIALNDKKEMGFLPLTDLKQAAVSNRKFQGTLQSGDEVLVKVVREPMKTKDYTLTTLMERSSRYAAARMGKGDLLFSKKLSFKDKEYIINYLVSKAIVTRDKKLIGCEDIDITIRTEASSLIDNQQLDLLKQDMECAAEALKILIAQASTRTCYTIHEKPQTWFYDIWKEIQACGFEIEEYVTDQFEILNLLKEVVPEVLRNKIRFYQDDKISLSTLYGLKTKIEEILQVKVWLPSGGYLCIEPTEALTVIDVNTGKAIYKGKDNETLFYEINKEAACEVMRQLRLRNISGMVLIDFINMKSKEAESAILKCMKKCAETDYSKITIYDFTKLGLVEMTRSKVSRALHEVL